MSPKPLLSLSALALVALGPTSFGPPTLCVPFEIGNAESLPFGSAPFEGAKDYDLGRLRADTMKILGASTDAEVHFETLRRATVYLMSGGKTERKKQQQTGKLAADLHEALRTRVLDVVSAPRTSKRAQALAWFDLGLFELDMDIIGTPRKGRIWPFLDKAATLVGDDPGLDVCLFAAGFSQRKETWWRPHLARALSAPDTLSPRTRTNLLRLGARFLGKKDMESLRKDYGPRLGEGKR